MLKQFFALLFFATLATPSLADEIYGPATFIWAPASGPVVSYAVFVRRSGEWGETPEPIVRRAQATVTGFYGQTISVRVAARDAAGNQGPFSLDSDLLLFAKVEDPPVLPASETRVNIPWESPVKLCEGFPAWKMVVYSDHRPIKVLCLKTVFND